MTIKNQSDAMKLANDIQMAMITKPALTMLEVFLPSYVTDEINTHIDSVRDDAKSFSHELVGQIKSNEKSAQLDMDFKHKPVLGLKKLLEGFALSYLNYQGIVEDKIDSCSMWSVHSYEGDYNQLHDHGVRTDMGMSCILYLKVPPQIEKLPGSAEDFVKGGLKLNLNGASGSTDGFTFFSWGINGSADIKRLKPVQESFVKPEVGKLLMFPNWLKHAVSPFYGEGERRTLSANFEIETKQAPILADTKVLAQTPTKESNEITGAPV